MTHRTLGGHEVFEGVEVQLLLLLSYETTPILAPVRPDGRASIYCRHGSRTAAVRLGAGMDVVVLAGRRAGDRRGPSAWRRIRATLPCCNGSPLEIWHGAELESTVYKFDDRSLINEAALSPDGSQIAFIRLTPPPLDPKDDIGTDLYLVNRDGSSPRALVKHRVYGEYMSDANLASGRFEIAYGIATPADGDRVDQHIEAVEVMTGARRRLVENADQPVVLPNGKHLLVRSSTPGPSES